MKLTDISGDINEWFNGSGPLADIVISSRIRLARNLAGHRFLSRCSAAEKARILKKLKDIPANKLVDAMALAKKLGEGGEGSSNDVDPFA